MATVQPKPWGSFEILGQGDGYQLKRLTVQPGQRLSLQLHHQRLEVWVVVNGAGEVSVGGVETKVSVGDVVRVPREAAHRIINSGSVPMELIEVQLGSYLEEDDIVRLDDAYGRAVVKERSRG